MIDRYVKVDISVDKIVEELQKAGLGDFKKKESPIKGQVRSQILTVYRFVSGYVYFFELLSEK